MGYDDRSADIKRFRKRVGYEPNIDKPTTHCEHVMRKKYRDRNPMLPITADKIAIRKTVKDFGLGEILVPIYRCEYKKLDTIKKMPCMVKMNNASGRNVLVENEKDKLRAITAVNRWFDMPYGEKKGEWCYKNIRPGYIIEPLLWKPPEQHIIYRFLCWRGKPQYIEAHEYAWKGKKPKTAYHTMFNVQWQRQAVSLNGRDSRDVPKPKNLKKMTDISCILSAPFDFVRIDLFEHSGKVMFSEITHYPRSGQYKYDPIEFDYKLGRLWK